MNPTRDTRLQKLFIVLVLFPLTVCIIRAQESRFSRDSAYAVLEVLAGDIGPRPMGSPAEKRALDYAVSKFAAYGCQESYVMPFTRAWTTNTTSGIAVGILKGRTGRIILIGGHIDSAGPEIPGANDDGSGAACVIELARVMGGHQHESTIVFCCWGGEEEGLRGSEYFVKEFPSIDSVALMLQIDMADGSGRLEIDPDGPLQVSAPRWLTEAAYDIYYNVLGYTNMSYPTHLGTLNSSLREGSGSDHISFLVEGIPAIDFTSDVNYPIHTVQDNLANFNPSGLDRSGNLVLKLAERFDGGVPSRGTEEYYLVQAGTAPVFVLHWVLGIFIVISVVTAGAGLFVVRRRNLSHVPEGRVRWTGLKVLLALIIIVTFVWTSDHLVGILNGSRFPWVNNFPGFVVLGILSGLVGLWLILQMIGRFRLTLQPFGLYLRALVILIIYMLLLLLANVELAAYAAFALFFVGLAAIVRVPALKLAFVIISPYLMFRLVFSEWLGMFQRVLALNNLHPAVVDGIYVLAFTILLIPFAYAFAAVYRDSGNDLFWLRRYRHKWGLAPVMVLAAGTTFFLAGRPVYDIMWQTEVRVEQRYVAGADTSSLKISSSEYLDRLRIHANRHDTTISRRQREFVCDQTRIPPVLWATINARTSAAGEVPATDSSIVLERNVVLRSSLRPLSVQVVYRSQDAMSVSSPWASGGRRTVSNDSEKMKTFFWYSYPDTVLTIPVRLGVRKGQNVAETITVVYDSLAYPLIVQREFTNVTRRTIISRQDTIKANV